MSACIGDRPPLQKGSEKGILRISRFPEALVHQHADFPFLVFHGNATDVRSDEAIKPCHGSNLAGIP